MSKPTNCVKRCAKPSVGRFDRGWTHVGRRARGGAEQEKEREEVPGKKEKGELVRKLDVSTQMNNSIDYEFEEKDFRLSMLEDQMASEKLSEGITGFSKAIEELEELLLKRYSEIKNHKLISAN